MTLRVTFDLSNKDLAHFRTIMREARDAAKDLGDEAIIESASGLLKQVDEARGSLPEFVTVRLGKLRTMINMVTDEEWRIPAVERSRVLNALAYFAEPEDLIPDHIPGLGFLDDAIMVELVVRELRHEIEAYEDFCAFREDEEKRRGADAQTPEEREQWLAKRRKRLHERMRRRATRSKRARRRGGGARIRLF